MQQPQDEHFKHITCEKLTIKRPSGLSKIELSVDSTGAYIDVYNRNGKPAIKLSLDNDGTGHVETFIDTTLTTGTLISKGSL